MRPPAGVKEQPKQAKRRKSKVMGDKTKAINNLVFERKSVAVKKSRNFSLRGGGAKTEKEESYGDRIKRKAKHATPKGSSNKENI